MNKQKEFIVFLIVIMVLAVLALGSSVYYYAKVKTVELKGDNSSVNTINQNQNTQNNNTNQTTKNLKIFSLSPSFGPLGTVVTVSGEGFTSTNNTVSFSRILLTGISSHNGTTLSFIVSNCPTSAPFCPGHLLIGPLDVFVSNANGASNKLPFTVTKTSL